LADKAHFEINSAEVAKLLADFPIKVRKRVEKTGLRRAGQRMRTMIRRDAPKQSGDLHKAIGVSQSRKTGKVWVGLKALPSKKGKGRKGSRVPFYYKLLDLRGTGKPSRRGGYIRRGKDRPWFLKSVERHSKEAANKIVDETKKALYAEAGKYYARSKSMHRRR
jgi:hypothetical protein